MRARGRTKPEWTEQNLFENPEERKKREKLEFLR